MPPKSRRTNPTQFNDIEIAQRAYQRWIARGCPQSDGREDWFAAEAELRAEETASQRGPLRSALRRLGLGSRHA